MRYSTSKITEAKAITFIIVWGTTATPEGSDVKMKQDRIVGYKHLHVASSSRWAYKFLQVAVLKY